MIYTNTERKLKSAFRTKAHVRSARGGKIPASVEEHYFRELLEAHKERGRRERGSTARGERVLLRAHGSVLAAAFQQASRLLLSREPLGHPSRGKWE